MKKIILAALILLNAAVLYSQNSDNSEKMETLFGNGDVSWGGYGCPEVKFTPFNSQAGLLVGGRGGVIINHSFLLGLAGYGIVTSHKLDDYKVYNPYYGDSSAYLRMGYGGLHLGVILEPNQLVHITTGMLIGAGWAGYTRSYSFYDNDNNHNYKVYESTPFFVFEPSAGVELNVASFFRIELNASYRIVSGADLPVTNNTDLSGFSGGIAFKFGKF